MRFICSNCNSTLIVRLEDLGQIVGCQSCQAQINVPNNEFGPGRILGDYIVRGTIVNRGHEIDLDCIQISLERQVVVKAIKGAYNDNLEYVHEFIATAKLLSTVYHPNLSPIYYVGQEDGNYYLVREASDNTTLQNKLEDELILSWRESLAIIQDIAAALDYAWINGQLLHFNLKPSNICIYQNGFCKLADIAIDRLDPDKNDDRIIGTPEYLAPERIVGIEGDNRSDIYSLGVMLYRMITGDMPFVSKNISELCTMHLEEDHIPPNQKIGSIPIEVTALVDRMLAKNPNDRYTDGLRLINDIELIVNGYKPTFAMPGGEFIPLAEIAHTKLSHEINFDDEDLASEEIIPEQPIATATVFTPPAPSQNETAHMANIPIAEAVEMEEQNQGIKMAEPVDMEELREHQDDLVGAGTESRPIKRATSVRKPKFDPPTSPS